jgi:hypothetical protein
MHALVSPKINHFCKVHYKRYGICIAHYMLETLSLITACNYISNKNDKKWNIQDVTGSLTHH